MTIPGSGNSVVDFFEFQERQKEQTEKTLDCGCTGRCSCDDGDEE